MFEVGLSKNAPWIHTAATAMLSILQAGWAGLKETLFVMIKSTFQEMPIGNQLQVLSSVHGDAETWTSIVMVSVR